MSTVIAYSKKEILELIRTYKFLILGFVILFFSISTPIVLYVTPKILKQQFTGEIDFSQLIQLSQSVSITNYLSDVYQIFNVIVLFFALKIFTDEFKSHKVIIPFMSGANLRWMYITKLVVFNMVVLILLLLGSVINHVYSGLIFEDFTVSIVLTIQNTLNLSLFVMFNLSIMLALTRFTFNKFLIIFVVLLNYYLAPGLLNMMSVLKYSPYKLIQLQMVHLSTLYLGHVLVTCVLILLFTTIGLTKIKKY